jgi:hypothetical protein
MTQNWRLPQSKLAGISRNGKPWVNPHVPKTITIRTKRIDMHSKLRKHERVEHAHMKKGMPYPQAHQIALKHEHKNMTPHQIAVYEGHNGAVARWHPTKKRRK